VEAAIELAAAAAQARTRLALAQPPRAQQQWTGLLAALRERVPDERFSAAWQRGRRWETADAVSAALSIAGAPAVTPT
jgi:hypothetical protein